MSDIVRPLAGTRVIDLSVYVAAPVASMTLGFLGADVIKVEPLKGEPYRTTGSGFGLPVTEACNPLFDTCNDYKRSVALDLRSEEGRAALRRMIRTADFFVTNYREQALVGMGCTFADVIALNSGIVYGKIDGYGEQGTDAGAAGFDATAFYARSGFANEASYDNGPPIVTPSGSGDTFTGLALTSGLLAAYVQARETGVGTKVSASLLATALWSLASPIVRRQFAAVRKDSLEDPWFLAICTDYRCQDGAWVRFCGMSAERYWPAFCRALGLEAYLEDARFATSAAMAENGIACYRLIADAVAERSYAQWEPVFRANDLPYDLVINSGDAVWDPQAIVNGFVSTVAYPDGKVANLPMPPMKIEGMQAPGRQRAPRLGEHTHEVLASLGYDPQALKDMARRGVINQ